jgi:hypothetical protein
MAELSIDQQRAIALANARIREAEETKQPEQPAPSLLESISINARAPELLTQFRSLIQNSEFARGSNNPLTAGIVKGAAGVASIPFQTAENLLNLSRAATGTVAGMAGRTDLMPNADVRVPGNFQSTVQGLNALGLNTVAAPGTNDPTIGGYRVPVTRGLEILGENAPAFLMPGASAGQSAASVAGQIVGEQVGGDTGRMVGGMAPYAASAAYSGIRGPQLQAQQQANAQRDATAAAARAEGYRFPPNETNPGVVNSALEGYAGKLTTRQRLSAQNSDQTTRLAKQSIGLRPTDMLDEGTLQTVRANAGQAYERVKTFGAQNNLRIRTDAAFRRDLSGLDKDIQAAAREFPDLVRTPEIDALRTSLNVPTISPTAAVELAKNLRFQSAENAKAMGNPRSRALSQAQRQAAEAVEGLVERTLSRSGQQQLFNDFREARTTIARSYDVERALNESTGTVNARILATLQDSGRPLGGGLEVSANAYRAFPRSMQTPEMIGSQPGISPLDVATGVVAAGQGKPGLAATMFGRPLVRNLITSGPYQRAMGTPSYEPMLTPDSGLAAVMRGYLSGNMTQ